MRTVYAFGRVTDPQTTTAQELKQQSSHGVSTSGNITTPKCEYNRRPERNRVGGWLPFFVLVTHHRSIGVMSIAKEQQAAPNHKTDQ